MKTGMPGPQEDETSVAAPPDNGLWRRLRPLIVLVAILALVFATGLYRLVSLEEIKGRQAIAMAWIAAHPVLASAAFLAATMALMAIGFPIIGGVTFAGGFFFGLWSGTALSLIGGTAGGLVFFLAARHARNAALASRRLRAALTWLEGGFRGDEFLALTTLRLIPIFPTVAVTLAAAAARVSVRDFILASLIGAAPAALIYAALGAGAAGLIASGGSLGDASVRWELLAPLAGLAGLMLLAIWLRRRARRR